MSVLKFNTVSQPDLNSKANTAITKNKNGQNGWGPSSRSPKLIHQGFLLVINSDIWLIWPLFYCHNSIRQTFWPLNKYLGCTWPSNQFTASSRVKLRPIHTWSS